MAEFTVLDPAFEERVRASFARQTLMTTIGASLSRVTPGEIEIVLPFRADLAQQHGFIHAGITTTIVDTACGYAALTLTPAAMEVLTVEYKVNFMSSAVGEQFVARARVIKAGRTLTVSAGDVYAQKDGSEKLIITMLATIMALPA